MAKMTMPRHQWNGWSREEDDLLLSLRRNRVPFREVARALQTTLPRTPPRSVDACIGRSYRLAGQALEQARPTAPAPRTHYRPHAERFGR